MFQLDAADIDPCCSIKFHWVEINASTYPGVPHAVSLGSKSLVFFAKPKSATLMSASSVSDRESENY